MTALRVRLGDRPLGRLATREGRIFFEYDPAFLADPLPVSPFSLPVRPGVFEGPPRPFEGLHGLFDDSLPDGWGRLLLDRRMAQAGVPPARLRPLDRLAWLGTSAMGALTYEPEIPQPEGPDRVDLESLARDAEAVLEGHADEVVPRLLAVGGSPGGARPKALVWIGPGDRVVHGRETDGEPWMVKFRARSDPPDASAVEAAYNELARLAGVEVPETALLAGFFASRRFDRVGRRRVHVHTFCGLVHADHRVPSATWEDLLKLTRTLTRSEPEVERQVRRMVFDVLAHNRDDHTRNHAFRMDDEGRWTLAPAYDLTFSEGLGGEQSLSVGGSGHPGVEHLRAAGRTAGVRADAVEEAIEAVRGALAAWNEVAAGYGVRPSTRKRIGAALRRV